MENKLFDSAQQRIASVIGAKRLSEQNSGYAETGIKKKSYTYTSPDDKKYTITQDAFDWIKKRYSSSWDGQYGADDADQARRASGAMPGSYKSAYSGSQLDDDLFKLGLPSSKKLESYIEAYQSWYGDGKTVDLDKDASQYISDVYKKSWTYAATAEDQTRKAQGLMPIALASKYGDSYAEEDLMKRGLPSLSDLEGYWNQYATHTNNSNRVNQFYATVAAKLYGMKLGGYGNDDTPYADKDDKGNDLIGEDGTAVTRTGKERWQSAFFDLLDQDEWADVRALYKRDAAVDVKREDYATEQEYREAVLTAQKKAAKSDDDLIFSYDDFITNQYSGYEKKFRESKIVDDAISAAYGDDYTYGDYERDAADAKQREVFAGITTKEAALSYVADHSGDDPVALLQEMYNGGVAFKHIRQVKRALLDMAATDAQKAAIKAAFTDLRDQHTEASNGALGELIQGWLDDHPLIAGALDYNAAAQEMNAATNPLSAFGDADAASAKADQASEQIQGVFDEQAKARRQLAEFGMFAEQYEKGETSAVRLDDAIPLFKDALDYDSSGSPTASSVEAAAKILRDAGASDAIIDEAAKRCGVSDGATSSAQSYWEKVAANMAGAVQSSMLGVPVQPEQQVDYVEAVAAELPDKIRLTAEAKAQFVEDGSMTPFEFDQAAARYGWRDALDMPEYAKDYFTEVEYPAQVEAMSKADKAAFDKLPKQEQLAIAGQAWESMDATSHAEYEAWFNEYYMALDNVAKSTSEVLKYQGMTSILTKCGVGMFRDAVNLADMVSNGLTGSSDTWQFTKDVNDFANLATNYGRTNQSLFTQGVSLASDMGAELLRMYTMNALGSAVASAFGKTAIGVQMAGYAGATLKEVPDVATKGLVALSKAGIYAIQSSPFMASAAGSYYAEAIQGGATVDQATAYGIVCGMFEGAVEAFQMDMWTGKALGSNKLFTQLQNGAKGVTRDTIFKKLSLIRFASSFLGEAGEEMSSYVLSWAMKRMMYNHGEKFDATEMIKQGVFGGILGLFGAGIESVRGTPINTIYQYMESKGATPTNTDLLASAVWASTKSESERQAVASSILTDEEWSSVQVNMRDRALDRDRAKGFFDAGMQRIDADLETKRSAYERAMSEYSANMLDEAAGRRANEALSAYQLEQAQYDEKKQKLESAFAYSTRQANDSLSAAQAKMDSHMIALYNLFQPEIAAMYDVVEASAQYAAAQEKLASSYSVFDEAYRYGATYSDDMFDALDTATYEAAQAISESEAVSPTLSKGESVLSKMDEKMRNVRAGTYEQYQQAQEEAAQQAAAQPEAKPRNLVQMDDKARQNVLDFAKRIKANVVIDEDADDTGIRGSYKDGVIHISSLQLENDGGDPLNSPEAIVLKHELTHWLESGGKSYAELSRFVLDYAYNTGWDNAKDRAFKAEVRKTYEARGDEYTDEIGTQEFVAYFCQDKLLRDEKAIKALVRQRAWIGGRILNWVQYKIAASQARSSNATSGDLALKNIEYLYIKAFGEAKKSPTSELRKYSVVMDAQFDYRVIADIGISPNMSKDEALEIAKAEIAKLRGIAFTSLIDGETVSVAAKNKTAQKLYKPGLPMNDTKYANRLAIASQMGEAITASAPIPGTESGPISETHSTFKATSRSNRSVIVEIPEFGENGKLNGARVYRVSLVILGNDGGNIAYDISRIDEIKEGAHSDLLRLKEQGVDIDRESLKQIVADKLPVVNSNATGIVNMKNAQHTLRKYSAGVVDANSSPAVDDGGRLTTPYSDSMPQSAEDVNAVSDRRLSTGLSLDQFMSGDAANALMDARYDKAVSEAMVTKDWSAVRKMVDDYASKRMPDSMARDESGKLLLFFHGTPRGFSEIDTDRSGYFTLAKDVAQTYTIPKEKPAYFRSQEYLKNDKNALYGDTGILSCYLDLKNVLVVDCGGSDWMSIEDTVSTKYSLEIRRDKFGGLSLAMMDMETGAVNDSIDIDPQKSYASVSDLVSDLGMLGNQIGQELSLAVSSYDAKDSYADEYTDDDGGFLFSTDVKGWPAPGSGSVNSLVFEVDELGIDTLSTDTFKGLARKLGYSGILFENVIDVDNVFVEADSSSRGGDTEAYIFDPRMAKSADLVTYDDNGVAIPLSRRFDTTNPDKKIARNMRYSTGMSYDEMLAKYGAQTEGKNPRARDIAVPTSTDGENRTSLVLRSAMESQHIPADLIDKVEQMIVDEGFGTYIPKRNPALVAQAKNSIAIDGIARTQQSFIQGAEEGTRTRDIDVATGLQLLAEASARGDTASVMELVASLCMIGTESGRAVQAFSLLKELGGAGGAYYMQKLVNRLNVKYRDQIAKGKMQPISVPVNLMESLINAKTAYEVQDAENAISKYIGENLPLSLADRLSNWRYFAMLANPVTHWRNILGNVLMSGLRGAKDFVAWGIERVAVKDQTQHTHALYSAANQSAKVAYAKSSFEKHKGDLVSGGKYGFEQLANQSKRLAKANWLNGLEQFNFNALEAEDMVFLRSAYVNAYTQYLVAQNIDPMSITDEQDAKAAGWAGQEALKATFRDYSAIASWVNQLAQSGTVAKILVEGIMPFKKTPVNIAKRGIEYSPAGLIMGAIDLCRAAKEAKATGNPKNVSAAVEHFSSGIVGTGLLGLGMLLAKAGLLRGSGEDDEGYEKFLTDTGEQAYAFTVGDVSINLSTIAPATIPLFMGVELYHAIAGDSGTFELSDLVTMTTGMLNPLMEMSFLSSINSALSTYEDNKIGGVVQNVLTSYASQYVPTIGGKIAKVIDSTERTTKGSAASPLKKYDQPARSILSKIPGVEMALEPYVTVKGETIKTSSFGEWALDFANQFILPGKVTIKNRDSVDRALIALYESTGNVQVFPTLGKKVLGKDHALTAEEYTEYCIARGEASYAAIKAVMQKSSYRGMSDSDKADAIEKAISRAEKSVLDQYKEKHGLLD